MGKKLTLLFLLLFFIVSIAVAKNDGPQPLAIVKQLTGPAWLIRSQTLPLAKGMELKSNDTIRTGQQSSVEIRFCDRHAVKLESNTTLKITGLEGTEKKEWVSIYLEVGQIFVDVWKRLQTTLGFEVESQAGIAGVRGTEFTVLVDRSGNMQVSVQDGLVELTGKNGGGTVELSKGQSSSVAPGGSPSKPERSNEKKSDLQDGKNNGQSGRSNKGSGNGSGHDNGGNGGGHGGGKK